MEPQQNNVLDVQITENPAVNLRSGSLEARDNQERDAHPCDVVSLASENSRSSADQHIIQKLADSHAELTKFSQENFKLQQRTNKTMEAMVANQDLPSLTMEKFNGDPASFPGFVNEFESLIKEKIRDPTRRFPFLLQYCEGEALRVIQDFRVLPANEAFKEAWDTLRLHFGQNHLVARALVDSLLKYEHLEKNRSVALGKKLLEFSTKMTSVRVTLKTYGREADVNSSETLKVLVAKLPNFGINEWKKDAAQIYEGGREPNLDDFIKLVKRLAARENHTYSEIQSSKEKREYASKDKPESGNRKRGQPVPQAKVTTYAQVAKEGKDSKDSKESNPKVQKSPSQGSKSFGECLYCKKPHSFEKCFKFKNLEVKDRVEFGKKERICFNCLKTGHLSSNCRVYPNCCVGGCKLKHHSLFHYTQAKSSSPESTELKPSGTGSLSSSRSGSQPSGASLANGAGASIQTAHILLNPNPICLGILPVRIKAKGGKRSVEGYAFLDNGSTGTVFLESLVDQLGAEATPTILNCETMNATTREECVTLDLRIESLDESGFVECTGYSRKDLTVGNKSIPTKEQI